MFLIIFTLIYLASLMLMLLFLTICVTRYNLVVDYVTIILSLIPITNTLFVIACIYKFIYKQNN